jgi:propanediol dehydratase small subunit
MSTELLLGVAILIAVVYVGWSQRRAYVSYRVRKCAGALWRRRFPSASKAEIRLFLDCFVEGMGFPRKLRLQFRPDDEVIGIYRSLYGGKTPVADSMECESFAELLASEFKVPLPQILKGWHEKVTLEELFAVAHGSPVLPNTSFERTRGR